ncbi:hypothetical protein [Candidatus Pelagibacter sp.]|uniref:hypothetical protein n=1 Tax=Candidatus Pelagibacter sp. TaxID=2024849 RepID=UPI003F84F85F
MNKKKGLQLSLIVLLILSSIIFYQKFFNQSKDLIETKVNEKEIFNNDSDNKIENSNTIETLKYISQDLVGNTYVINADTAKFEENNVENITLYKVNAEIIRQDNETIKIFSEIADYNKKNNNTVFEKAVRIEYDNQTIKAEVVKLNFTKNLIEIIENVHYMSDNTNIYADKVELDYLRKKMKISMNNQNDNIQITGKY